MRYALARLGHCCEAVANLDAALAAMATFAPDVVLYEWMIGREPLHAAPARLRAISRSPVKVFALSYADEPDGFHREEQIDAYFTKPIDLEALDRAIRR